jgi:nucleoside-diphosphate-sugar epimerase
MSKIFAEEDSASFHEKTLMYKTTILTGAGGFLGRAMLEALSLSRPQDRFLVLARKASINCMQSRFSWIEDDRVRFIPVELGQDDLGLSSADRAVLLDQANEIWHMAACTTFDEKRDAELFEVNVGGTNRLLDLARKARNLENFYFTSTAYVVGIDRKAGPEDELPAVTKFNNTYEATKWQAEKQVRDSGLPFTIFRPSIIMERSDGRCEGESRMMYGYLLGLYSGLSKYFRAKGIRLRDHLGNGHVLECDFRVAGHKSVTKNFVCVDDVVNTMMAIVASPICHRGRTYNLTSADPVSTWQMREAVEGALRVRGIQLVGDTVPDASAAEDLVIRQTRTFSQYVKHSDPDWPTTNTDAAIHNRHERVGMSSELFAFLLRSFVEQCIIKTEDARAL